MTDPEIPVLSEQLDEILSTGIDDEEEALELAALAGMLLRKGADPALLAEADAWRKGAGSAFLEEAFEAVDVEAYVGTIEALMHEDATEEQVEEAVLDFDELVAAAVWAGKTKLVAAAAREVEQTIRLVPEIFAALAPVGKELARLRGVAERLEVYGWWLAIADAKPAD